MPADEAALAEPAEILRRLSLVEAPAVYEFRKDSDAAEVAGAIPEKIQADCGSLSADLHAVYLVAGYPGNGVIEKLVIPRGDDRGITRHAQPDSQEMAKCRDAAFRTPGEKTGRPRMQSQEIGQRAADGVHGALVLHHARGRTQAVSLLQERHGATAIAQAGERSNEID